MKKHPDCEANGCALKEHKGYTTCQRSGCCSELYNAECCDVFRELVGLCKVYEEDRPGTDRYQITIWQNSIMDRAIRLRLSQGADDLLRSASGHRATAERCAEIAENCSGALFTARSIRAYAATLPEAPQSEKRAGGTAKVPEEFERLTRLADELCVAVDNAADDIGGSRRVGEILAEFGPATDAALELLADAPSRNGNDQGTGGAR